MMCTRNDDEIRRDLKPEQVVPKMAVFTQSWAERIKNVYHNKTLFESSYWLDLLKW